MCLTKIYLGWEQQFTELLFKAIRSKAPAITIRDSLQKMLPKQKNLVCQAIDAVARYGIGPQKAMKLALDLGFQEKDFPNIKYIQTKKFLRWVLTVGQ